MIDVHDNRKTDECRICEVDLDGYFYFGDVLCRRVAMAGYFRWEEDGIPFVEVPCGKVDLMDRRTWVQPVRDEQISVSVEDWG